MNDSSSDLSAENIEWFFNELEPLKLGYKNPEFSYALRVGNNGARVLAAQLLFTPVSSSIPERNVSVGNYYAFRGKLETLGVSPRDLIEQLLGGEIPAPNGKKFRLDRDERPSKASIIRGRRPLAGLDPQQRILYLTTFLNAPVEETEDDAWTLRSANPPFGNINDFLGHIGLSGTSGEFQTILFPPIAVDVTSAIRGEVAHLKVRLPKALPMESASLGIAVYAGGKESLRERLPGSKFEWSDSPEHDGIAIGTAELSVPKASVAHCFACYDKASYHNYWIGDANATQNPLRTIYELFDPQLGRVADLLSQPAKRGITRDHESAVASLLWVLGFSPLHLVAVSDAPDVIAVSSDGNIVVVECTLSSLKTDNKIQKLLDRTNEIRKALDRSNIHGKTCIPVMVTSKSYADIVADIEDCTKRGIMVITQDEIEPGFPSTIMPPNSADRFRELKERLQAVTKTATGTIAEQ